MKRRGFVLGLGTVMAAWPLAAHAQQGGEIKRIGVLVLGNPDPTRFVNELKDALQKLGRVEGRNVELQVQSAEAEASALPNAAAELVRRKVDIIVAWQTPAATAAKRATAEIPIVMTAGDPVGTGIVASLSRPGGNVTGMDSFGAQLGGKCVELIRDTLPAARRVAILANVADPFTKSFLREIDKAAGSLGIATQPLMSRPGDEFAGAFEEMRKNAADAVIIQPTLLRPAAVDLALKHRLPSFSIQPALPVSGGLMSYAVSFAPQVQELAGYVDRILHGSSPADLPVMHPTKFELVINLKTAKALGLTIPPALLLRADEVIE